MAVSNTLQEKPKGKPKFSLVIQTEKYKNLINSTLGDPNRARRFVASITSAVAINPVLQECDYNTVLSGALLGESLNLNPSPQLGQYYLVPYNVYEYNSQTKQRELVKKNAQFQMGYKGYVQLAIRSGYYKKLIVLPIKAGELVRYDTLEETIELNSIEDEEVWKQTETIGYYTMFEYLNGFRKALYWSKGKMEKHADKYSQAFSMEGYKKLIAGEIPQKDMWKYSSFWYKNFDDMACKTMLRQLISKWGIMSIDLQEAFEKDMAILKENGNFEYIDTEPVPDETPYSEMEEQADNGELSKELEMEDTVCENDMIEDFFNK